MMVFQGFLEILSVDSNANKLFQNWLEAREAIHQRQKDLDTAEHQLEAAAKVVEEGAHCEPLTGL